MNAAEGGTAATTEPVLILGGMRMGWFTPTEAAAMSAVYAFVIAVFVYKDMGLKDVPRVLPSRDGVDIKLKFQRALAG